MKCLVTGGLGFIGSNLVDYLISLEHEVFTIDDLSTGLIENANEKAINIYDDISNICNYEKQIGKIDIVFHLAAVSRIQPSFEHPAWAIQTNVQGTADIADFALKNNATLVYAGSSTFYGGIFKNPYSFSKHQGEKICEMYSKIYGLKSRVARFFNVYGPRQISTGINSTVLGIFERQFLNGENLTITGDGSKKRDFVHVKDICQGLYSLSMTKSKRKFITCDLGSGKNISIKELANLFVTDEKISYLPDRRGEDQETLADIRKSLKHGFKPDPYNSLERYIADFKSNAKT